jgi:hypothetical protein
MKRAGWIFRTDFSSPNPTTHCYLIDLKTKEELGHCSYLDNPKASQANDLVMIAIEQRVIEEQDYVIDVYYEDEGED